MSKISLKPLDFSKIKNSGQVKKSQSYYDDIARKLENGMFSYNPKTGNTTYATKNGTTVLKGFWDDKMIWFQKHRAMTKHNPNPSVQEIVGKDNIIKHVSNTVNNTLPMSNCYVNTKPLSILA